MNPFATAAQGTLYPASTYARSAVPGPQNQGNTGYTGAAQPAFSTAKRNQIAAITAGLVFGTILLFHWHFNRG